MDVEKMKGMYRVMVRQRMFVAEQCIQNSRGRIYGYLHCYTGEEAVAAGVCAELEATDSVFSTHRAEGHLIAMGARLDRIMAECFGRAGGYAQGLGGLMHMSVPDRGVVHSNGVVGGGIGLAVGAALAHRYRKDGGVAVTFFGDGAANQGVLHEGMNLASIWKLPVIFVLENNGYAISSPASKMISVAEVAERARGYSMPGQALDGNDAVAVYEAASRAIARARAGEGPSFLECRTYRTRGHNEGDPQWYYRTKEECRDWETRRDPIQRLKGRMCTLGAWSDAEEERLREETRREIDEAVRFAEDSPPPLEALVDKYVWKER